MCGIFGFIGKSIDPQATFELTNALMIATEVRGEHATGFYACEVGVDSPIWYDKEPVKSSIYTNRSIWKDGFSQKDADLFIGHCRYSSMGVGNEKTNKNNHPHVSGDKRIALVHNGRIPEYQALKNRYDLRSECDSEILLGMYETGGNFKGKEEYLKVEFPQLPHHLAFRMMGMKEIFSRVTYGAMAVSIAEREDDGKRIMWLFRDEERPLHLVDLRKTLGQIFFCSTPFIWRNAVEATPNVKQYMPNDTLIIEFPPNQVWMTHYNPIGNDWLIKKFRVTKTKFSDYNEDEDKPIKQNRKPVNSVAPVYSRLHEENEDIVPDDLPALVVAASPPPLNVAPTVSEEEKKKIATIVERKPGDEGGPPDKEIFIPVEEIWRLHEECTHLVKEIGTVIENKLNESSDLKTFEECQEALKALQNELQGTLAYLG